MKLDHINLSAEKLSESVEWYQKLFGFEQVEAGTGMGGQPFVVLRQGDALLCIHEHPGYHKAALLEGARVHHVAHFGLSIQDGVAFEERARELKVAIEYGGEVRYPHSSSWYISDPSGHEIEVVKWDENTIRF